MELAPSEKIYSKPMHPYTKGLMSAIPIADPKLRHTKERIILEGEITSPINVKPGCRFANRCKYAMPICHQQQPELKELEPDHFTACHLY